MGLNNNLDLNLVRVFLAVYHTGSINGAARQLHLTQPAVSNAVRRLNERMGKQLFFRAGRGIRASEDANHIYMTIHEPYEKLTEAFTGFSVYDPATSSRKFSISLSNYFDALMPQIAKVVEHEGPGIRLERVGHRPEANLRDLRLGNLDLILTATCRNFPDLSSCALYSDRLTLIARPEHPLLRTVAKPSLQLMRRLRFASVIAECEQPTPATMALEEMGCSIFLHTTSFTNLLEIVMQTDHVALIPRLVLKRWQYLSTRRHEIPFEVPDVPLRLLWCKRNEHEGGNIWFRKLVKAVVEDVARDEPKQSRLPALG